MKFMTLAAIPLYAQILAVIFILTCIILIIIVLLQKGRGGGLAAAFGGAGGHSAFGSKTGDVFTKITIGIVAVFLILSMVLTKIWVPFEPLDEQTTINKPVDAPPPAEPKKNTSPAGDGGPTSPGSESGTSRNSTNPTPSDKPDEGN